jgi:hypothetical protein
MPTYVVKGTVEYEYTNIIEADDIEHLNRIVEEMAETQELNMDSLSIAAVDEIDTISDEDRIGMFTMFGLSFQT